MTLEGSSRPDKENVSLAYLALTLRGEKVDPLNLAEESLRIASVIAEDSIAMQAQRAYRIRATVTGVSFEESSQRYVLKYVAQRGGDGEEEQIRSDRIDRRFGKSVVEMFSELEPGDEVVIFKLNEKANDDKQRPNGYRRAVFVSVVHKKKRS